MLINCNLIISNFYFFFIFRNNSFFFFKKSLSVNVFTLKFMCMKIILLFKSNFNITVPMNDFSQCCLVTEVHVKHNLELTSAVSGIF